MQKLKKVQNCALALKAQLPEAFVPQIGIVLGTGLGDLVQGLTHGTTVPYDLLPEFPVSSAPSHRGAFVAGLLAGRPVLIQQGRCHLYEDKSPDDVCAGVRVMATLGVKTLVITNAAGAINPHFDTGSLMLIDDHINATGKSPLTGDNVDEWGPRFPDMSRAYDADLAALALERALELGIRLERGVYVCVPGPQLESRAETRAYRSLGGDAVGMSTALEVIAARHMGLRVLGISCLTNKNLPDCMAEATIEDIIATAQTSGNALARLIAALLPDL
ncbi:purine-nucleoside phosphorylase [Desulfovibrio sp. OttesenSCG-928-M16]|nr:purine-nucleoside phosphorylase [Desulfovibrio sp. OttesenSCG-928-M16]